MSTQPYTYVDKKIKGWENEEKMKESMHDPKFLTENIAEPLIINPTQRKYIKNLFGEKNLNDIELIVLSQTLGQLDQSKNHPDYEKYIDPITKKYKLRPVNNRIPKFGVLDKSQCDPKTEQHYVDSHGKGQCIPIITQGQFVCPPENDPTLTKIITLRDGTGLCVRNDFNRPQDQIYTESIFHPHFKPETVQHFLQMYDDLQIYSRNEIFDLNGKFNRYQDIPEELQSILKNDEKLKRLSEEIKNKDDIEMANIALYLHATDKQKGLLEKTDERTYMKFFPNINKLSQVSVMKGGCPISDSNMSSLSSLKDKINQSYLSD